MGQQELYEIQGGHMQSPTSQKKEPLARLGSSCAERGLGVLAEHKQGALAAKTGNSTLGFINRIVASY